MDLSAAPGPPQDLKTARVGPDYVTLEWKPPAKDGGAKITGYRVEKCEETSEEWVKVEDIKAFDTVYKVTSLKEGMGYYFSVSAKNQVGYGEPCETDKAIKPKKPEGMDHLHCEQCSGFVLKRVRVVKCMFCHD